jgi:hypothetical protein
MATRRVNKSQAVRDYLAAQPDAMPKEVMAALAEHGIKVSRVHVSTIKSKLKKTGGTGRKRRVAEATRHPRSGSTAEKPAKATGAITLQQIRTVARAVRTMGGYRHAAEVLEAIRELGGVKRFQDLADAMEGPVPDFDDIPF